MIPSRGVMWRAAAVSPAAALLILTGCGSGVDNAGSSVSPTTSPSASSPTASQTTASPSPTVNQAEVFCQAAKEWSESPAQQELQAALAANDNAAATGAFKAWTEPTKAMLTALPSDASAEIRVAFEQFASTIEQAGGGSLNANELANFQAASRQVTTYVGKECAPSPSATASDSQSASPSASESASSESASPTDSESPTYSPTSSELSPPPEETAVDPNTSVPQ